MKQQVTINYYGMQGTGDTLKEAKLDAGSKIEAAMKDDYRPVYIGVPGANIIVYRSQYGWCHLINNRTESYGWNTKQEALEAACFHVEQMNWTIDSDDTFPLLTIYPRSLRDLKSWAHWQRGYAQLKAQGYDDSYCREHADTQIV
jgi:hypothetical protein